MQNSLFAEPLALSCQADITFKASQNDDENNASTERVYAQPPGRAAALQQLHTGGSLHPLNPARPNAPVKVLEKAIFDQLFPPMKRRVDIQVLRAIAVLAVVLFHYDPKLLPGGFLGVDVFFVISGFLITSIILRQREAGEFSIWHFYQRRVNRILPALSAVLLFCLVLGIAAFPPREFQALFEHLPWSFAQVANFSFMRNTGYFDTDINECAVLHTWSLGVEEQFYLLWAPLLLLLWHLATNQNKPQKNLISKFLLVGILASFVIDYLLKLTGKESLSFYSPISRAWELGAGCMIACHSVSGRPNRLVSTLGFILIIGAFFIPASESMRQWVQLAAVAGSILAIHFTNTIFENGRGFSLLKWIGDRSYSLYLWHFPVLIFFPFLFFIDPGKGFGVVLSIAAIVSAAILSYRFIEKPFLSLTGKRARFACRYLLIGQLILGGGAFALMSEQDGEWRFGRHTMPNDGDHLSIHAEPPEPFALEDKEITYDSHFSRESPCEAVLVGDSHAIHYYPVIQELCKSKAVRLERFYALSFLAAGSGMKSEKFKFSRMKSAHEHGPPADYLLKEIEANPTVTEIFLAQRTCMFFYPPLPADRDRYTAMITTGENTEIDGRLVYAKNLERFCRRLTSKGKSVILLGQVPPLMGHPKPGPTWIEVIAKRDVDDLALQVRGKEAERLDFERRLYQKLAEQYQGVFYFDPHPSIPSHLDDAGNLLYIDDDHLNHQGAMLMLDRLKSELK